jgi:hypothetical protein
MVRPRVALCVYFGLGPLGAAMSSWWGTSRSGANIIELGSNVV